MAKTSEDLEKLLLAWEAFCDRHRMETQIAKSLVVTEESERQLISRDGLLWERCAPRRFLEEFMFSYKGSALRIVENFKYLGVLFH